MTMKYDRPTKKYVVTEFVKEHNHSLGLEEYVAFLRSQRNLTEADIAQARTLQSIRVKTCKIIKLFVLQVGGNDKVQFVPKDLYLWLEEDWKNIVDSDTESAIAYLISK